jgi:hypothetical protein
VGAYKYFLETEAGQLKDRVHYFSSFYYMLVALSLVSAGGAAALTLMQLSANHLFRFRILQSSPPGTFTASVLVLAAAAVQLYTLRGLSSIRLQGTGSQEAEAQARERRAELISSAPLVLLLFALAWLTGAQIAGSQYLLLIAAVTDYRMWVLVTLAVVFERLGSKQWAAIIREQVVLVNDRAEAMRRIAEKTSV